VHPVFHPVVAGRGWTKPVKNMDEWMDISLQTIPIVLVSDVRKQSMKQGRAGRKRFEMIQQYQYFSVFSAFLADISRYFVIDCFPLQLSTFYKRKTRN